MSKFSFSYFIILILILVMSIPGVSQTRVGKLGVGVDASIQYMLGAGATNPSPAVGGGVSLSYSVMQYFGLRGKFCYSPITWKGGTPTTFTTDMMSLNLYAGSDLMPNSTFNIFPFIGGGVAIFDPRDDNGKRAYVGAIPVSNFDFQMMGGLSIDYFFSEFWSASLMGEYVLTNSAYYAGSAGGIKNISNNDSFMRASIQVRYYLFDSAFITKLLEAQRERSRRNK
ncbi:MAG: hypothetical protein NTX44_14940 [Ignavibacteriales bacterium]|nr:hypothetical protein [Ignavibacteriales bacterium]